MKRVRSKVFFFICCVCCLVGAAHAQRVPFSGETYFCAYDTTLQCPALVEWTLHRTDVGSATRSASWRFAGVSSVPGIRARHTDFTRSGFHRGHLCPAKDRSCTVAMMKTTFSVANIAPQVPALNVGKWLQSENACREYAAWFDSVSVVVVPIWLPGDTIFIGRNRLAVPHAFFKAVWCAADSTILESWFVWNK